METRENTGKLDHLRILILEDNPADAELMEYELREAGFVFTSRHVETKETYIEALSEFRPDMILSDYDLPSFTGAEALQIKKKHCPEIPFILVTGAVGEERAIEILTSGATDYVLKTKLSRLIPAVRRALQESYEHRKRKQAEAERDILFKELERRVQERTEALNAEIQIRKKNESELCKSEERFRTLFENALDAIILTDPTGRGRILSANPAACRMFGYTEEEFYRLDRDTLLDTSTAGFNDLMEQREKEGQSIMELTYRRKDGTLFPGLLSTKLFTDEEGNIRAVGIIRDMSERRKAEISLRESEEQFRSMFEASGIGMAQAEPATGKLLRVNKKAMEIIGYEQAELIGMPFSKFTHPDDRESDWEGFSRLVRGEIENYVVEKRVVHKNGDIVWCIVTVNLIRDAEGRPIRTVAVINDITERKRIEDALKRSEEMYRNLVIASPDAVVVHHRGQILFANPAALELFGAETFEQLAARRLQDLTPAFELNIATQRARDALEGRNLPPREGHILTLDGRLIPVEVTSSSLYFEGRLAVQAMYRNVIERRRAEEERKQWTAKLEAANKVLDAFTYSVSHDLKGPLRAMKGFTDLILADYGRSMDKELKRRFEVIRENTKKMDELIESLLALSRLERKKIALSRLDMKGVFESVWGELRDHKAERKIEFHLQHMLPAFGDRNLIRQVVYNLLSNAVKFTSKRNAAVIEAGSRLDGDSTTFYIKDNGIKDNGAGFDMHYYDKLFQVFKRLHGTAEFEGTGLGLAIVQRIITMHNGRVWAEGEVDKGATFYFSLPNTPISKSIF